MIPRVPVLHSKKHDRTTAVLEVIIPNVWKKRFCLTYNQLKICNKIQTDISRFPILISLPFIKKVCRTLCLLLLILQIEGRKEIAYSCLGASFQNLFSTAGENYDE